MINTSQFNLSDDIETNKEKVLVIIPHTCDNLGVWSVREMEGPGLDVCTTITPQSPAYCDKDLFQTTNKELRSKVQWSLPSNSLDIKGFAVAILNCGELNWFPEQRQPVTYTTMKTMSDKQYDEVKHRIPKS